MTGQDAPGIGAKTDEGTGAIELVQQPAVEVIVMAVVANHSYFRQPPPRDPPREEYNEPNCCFGFPKSPSLYVSILWCGPRCIEKTFVGLSVGRPLRQVPLSVPAAAYRSLHDDVGDVGDIGNRGVTGVVGRSLVPASFSSLALSCSAFR